jgi:S1-C subfamily serine protease
MWTGFWAFRFLILFIVCAGILNACQSIQKPDAAQSTSQIVVRDATGFMNAIEAVADSALPCVVQIEVSGSALEQVSPDGSSGLLQGIAKVPMHGLGSGILVNPEGHIITNNHVVENADSIVVHFYDGTERAAKLIGSDRFTDIAVIKVEGTGRARAARLCD